MPMMLNALNPKPRFSPWVLSHILIGSGVLIKGFDVSADILSLVSH